MKRAVFLGLILASFIGIYSPNANAREDFVEAPDDMQELDESLAKFGETVDRLGDTADRLGIVTAEYNGASLQLLNSAFLLAMDSSMRSMKTVGKNLLKIENSKLSGQDKRMQLFNAVCEDGKPTSLIEEDFSILLNVLKDERKEFGENALSSMQRDSFEETAFRIYGKFVDVCKTYSFGPYKSGVDFINAQITDLQRTSRLLSDAYAWSTSHDIDFKITLARENAAESKRLREIRRALSRKTR